MVKRVAYFRELLIPIPLIVSKAFIIKIRKRYELDLKPALLLTIDPRPKSNLSSKRYIGNIEVFTYNDQKCLSRLLIFRNISGLVESW